MRLDRPCAFFHRLLFGPDLHYYMEQRFIIQFYNGIRHILHTLWIPGIFLLPEFDCGKAVAN